MPMVVSALLREFLVNLPANFFNPLQKTAGVALMRPCCQAQVYRHSVTVDLRKKRCLYYAAPQEPDRYHYQRCRRNHGKPLVIHGQAQYGSVHAIGEEIN